MMEFSVCSKIGPLFDALISLLTFADAFLRSVVLKVITIPAGATSSLRNHGRWLREERRVRSSRAEGT